MYIDPSDKGVEVGLSGAGQCNGDQFGGCSNGSGERC